MKKKIYYWSVILALVILFPIQAFAAIQVKVEPNAGIHYFTELNSSSIGSGISLTVGKEVGKVQANDNLLGLKIGVNFVNPEVESIAKSKAFICTTVTEKKKHKSRSMTTCSPILVEETVHLTNFNLSWVAETEYNNKVFFGFEMGIDIWSSNLSSSDLGVRFGGNAAYKVKDNLKLKLGGVLSELAEADIHGQDVDISNAYFRFGGEWRF